MPQQQSKQPDFIPAPQPDFIPADSSATVAPEQPQGNAIQRAFDKAVTVTPEQQAGHGPVVNALQKFGAGAIQGAAGPFVHPLDTIEGIGHAIAHPQDAGHQIVQGAMDNPAGALGNLVGGGVLGGAAGEAGGALAKVVPTTGKAGAVFQDLNQSLANQPVNLTRSSGPMQQLEKVGAAGPGVPTTVGKMLDRSRMISPMNYPEARLFQENLAAPSTTEKMGMGGSMKGGVKQLNKAFYSDIKDAADQAGRGDDYAKAMRDYRIASTAGNIAKNVGKVAVPAAIGGGAYKLTRALEGGR
jgi:hypothetical protein